MNAFAGELFFLGDDVHIDDFLLDNFFEKAIIDFILGI